MIVNRILHDGNQNVFFYCSGEVGEGRVHVATDIAKLEPRPVRLRLDSVQFGCDDKLDIRLWWVCEEGDEYICTVRTAGKLDFGPFMGFKPTRDSATGDLAITFSGDTKGKMFALIFEMTKQGR